MASGSGRYQRFPEGLWSINRDVEDPQHRPTIFHPRQPWTWSPQPVPGDTFVSPISTTSNAFSDGLTLSPDRLLSSGFMNQSDEHLNRSSVHLPSKLPAWLWLMLSYTLGLSPREMSQPGRRICLATALHAFTFTMAICFGACGLIFNTYDTLSKFTNTTVLVCTAKGALGIFWILLGTYSHSLAARLFSSKGLLDYIRLHSKTFMKISTVFWITCISLAVVGANFYSSSYLLEDYYNHNKTDVMEATCSGVGLPIILCHIYFGSKVIFSCLSLFWNLIVTAVLLSVCRTHTICIRRFMRELSFDYRIYEEFYLLKNSPQQINSGPIETDFSEFDICDEFSNTDIEDLESPTNGESVLQSLRIIRHKRLSVSASITSNPKINQSRLNSESSNVEMGECLTDKADIGTEPLDESGVRETAVEETNPELYQDFSKVKLPIMSNEDLMLTYFKILKHIRSTSRLLQRWMSNWIVFIMMWCAMFIIYWVSHTATLSGIIQFLFPLAGLGLMTSGYAEVNFEAQRLGKCILPTEDRMPVIFYISNIPLELKIYSFVMTYNVLVTVVAGVALTFATRIILDNLL